MDSPRNIVSAALVGMVFVVCVLACRPVAAQHHAPFSRLSLALSVSQDFNKAQFQSVWDTSPAVDVSASLPFYYGDVRAAVRLIRAHAAELTDFNSAFFNVGWGPSFRVGSRSSVDLSVSAGSMYMSFTDETVSYRKSESELAVGVRAGWSTHIGGPVHAQVWGEWQHAFTSVPLDFAFISVGVKYDIVAPDWLKRFLD